jgi:hypothetical protein
MNRFVLFSAATILGNTLFAQAAPSSSNKSVIAQTVDVQSSEKKQSVDMDALTRWLQDKRLITVKEVGGDLSISGEVRTEAQLTNEKKKAQGSSTFIKQRGEGSPLKRPSLAWDVEFNLMMDYRTDRTWAAIKLEFDNDMGTKSGTVNKIKLEKAYLGGRLVAGDTFTWDAELGRRYLFNVYDSKVEFGSLFDGLLLRFSKAFIGIGDFYSLVGVFLVDDRFNQYGEAVEIGALRIANTGLNIKCSAINWYKPYPASENPQRWKFVVNQLLFSYQCYPQWIGKRLIKPYIAGLINPLAQRVEQTGYTLQNLAWYAGISIGVVKKAGDWAVDANYQWVQAQAVPDIDASGIGRGNAAGAGFYTTGIDGSGVATTQATAVGSGNYKGFEIEALYAFTDNLTLLQNLKISNTLNTNIGPNLKYKQWEMEFIYAF